MSAYREKVNFTHPIVALLAFVNRNEMIFGSGTSLQANRLMYLQPGISSSLRTTNLGKEDSVQLRIVLESRQDSQPLAFGSSTMDKRFAQFDRISLV